MTTVDMIVAHDPDNGSYGDCFRCCIASLLNLPAADVPHFMHDGPESEGQWYGRLNAFLAPLGLAFMDFLWAPGEEPDWPSFNADSFDCFYVICGTGARGERHCCVGRNGQVVHDPHVSKDGLVGPYADGEVGHGKYSYGFIISRCGA